MAFVLVAEPDALLLIRRAERAGDPWSGQMGLPGGRHHPGDPDLLATAIRETEEEVGLALDASRCIGVLDDVAPRTPDLPPIAVRPFVFSLA
ncbi:MAG TPA: NUDIX domain-containing protein, partial [Gemmatimonadales bacterium]|nr:NUDIX domain-containing protein [Gemmatimonadales bacterium]